MRVSESGEKIVLNVGDGWAYPLTEDEAEQIATDLRKILDERYKDRWSEHLTRGS